MRSMSMMSNDPMTMTKLVTMAPLRPTCWIGYLSTSLGSSRSTRSLGRIADSTPARPAILIHFTGLDG